ncbi:topoisomerase [Neisseria arctica]|uniref:Topoisomerase n=1 Tax=Neisseria arctica TaxID=1470200 RepID=A0A0J0YSW6_9NEIS|nr:ComEA family DNA-binding protein [Neisseria arctica]KLT73201.1 topoisomerase [Neisseria arctica]UOO87063.1 ComEA family DNA-binding protein [Neisseria arctica]
MKNIIMAALSLLGASSAFAYININTANVNELAKLPGIGLSKAAAIVAYRNQNGLFKSLDELKNVKGIGERIINRLREEATVGAVAEYF